MRKFVVVTAIGCLLAASTTTLPARAATAPEEGASSLRTATPSNVRYTNWFRTADGRVGCRYGTTLNPSVGYMTGTLTCLARSARKQVKIANFRITVRKVASSAWRAYRQAPVMPSGQQVWLPREALDLGNMPDFSCIVRTSSITCGMMSADPSEGVGFRLKSDGSFKNLSFQAHRFVILVL